MTLLLKSGATTSGSLLDAQVFDPTEEYNLYSAYVTGDGGTIQDAAACQAAITAAINGNYYSGIGFAISGRWGSKGLPASATAKFYSLNRIASNSTGATTSMSLNTATYGYAVIVFPDAGAFTNFAAIPLRRGSTLGVVMMDKASDTNAANGIGVQWTDSVVHWMFAGGTCNITPDTVLQGSPIYSSTSTDVSHFILDYDELTAIHGEDGVDLQSVTYFPSHNTAGETATLKVYPIGGANRHLVEMWYFNAASRDGIRQCGVDMGARY